MTTEADSTRHHGLDMARASMMVLGVVLHSMMNYITIPPNPMWPYRDTSVSPLFDLVTFCVHLFRIPAFYVISGFFAGLLIARRGAGAFLRNRAQRIAVPFVLSWLVLFPLIAAAFHFAGASGGGASVGEAARQAREFLVSGAFAWDPRTEHLYFLYYLIFFCLLAAAVHRLLPSVPAGWKERLGGGLERVTRAGWAPLWLGLLSFPLQLPMGIANGMVVTDESFVPHVGWMVTYGHFFLYGLFLYGRPGLLAQFSTRLRQRLLVGAAATAGSLVLALQNLKHPALAFRLAGLLCASVACWCFIFAVIGACLRYFHRAHPVTRYMTDASYWVYIVHYPITIALPVLLRDWPVISYIKWSTVFTVTLAIVLVSYNYLVRPTVVGKLLNGRRYPRGLPVEGRPVGAVPASE